MIILVSLVHRRPELSREDFVRRHREVHAPLFASSPAAQRYVRRYSAEYPQPVPGAPQTSFDAVVRQWFDAPGDILALAGAPDYQETIRADEARFIDMGRSEFYLAEEQVFLGE